MLNAVHYFKNAVHKVNIAVHEFKNAVLEVNNAQPKMPDAVLKVGNAQNSTHFAVLRIQYFKFQTIYSSNKSGRNCLVRSTDCWWFHSSTLA